MVNIQIEWLAFSKESLSHTHAHTHTFLFKLFTLKKKKKCLKKKNF